MLGLVALLGSVSIVLQRKIADQGKRASSVASELRGSLRTSQMETDIAQDYIKRLQEELTQMQQGMDDGQTTTTVMYPLSSRRMLKAENTIFSIVEFDSMMREVTSTLVGTFFPPSALEYERLTNGLYRFHGVADFTETGYDRYLYLNEKTAKALVVAGGKENSIFNGTGIHLSFSGGPTGNLMIHISSDTCEKNHRQHIDELRWNDQKVFSFSPPLEVRCDFSELGGGQTYFFTGGERVDKDLTSVTLTLPNGKRLVVKPAGMGVSVK